MNTNCLAGMECPVCASEGPFRIVVRSWATVSDEGTEEFGDIEWDDQSGCSCLDCKHMASIQDFRNEED